MATITIMPAQLGAILRETSTKLPEALKRGALTVAAERARARLASVSPVDMGGFKGAWQVVQEPGGVVVQNTTPYAGIIERGARPHPVSADGWMAIYRWTLRHITGMVTGLTDKGAHQGLIREAVTITNAIVQKLRTVGQEPKWLVRDNMPLFTNWVGQAMSKTLIAFFAKGGV